MSAYGAKTGHKVTQDFVAAKPFKAKQVENKPRAALISPAAFL
jgi:hypothetical protein